MQKQILISLLIGFSVTVVSAQQSLMVATPAMSADRGADKIYYANQNEPPRAIEFKARTITASYFVANINAYLGLSADFTFREVESNGDQLGMHHRLLQQYYKGIPIEGMSYRVHERDGFITSANGKAVRNMHPDLHTNISEQQAFAWAKQYVNTKDTTTRVGKKLIVSKGFTFAPESFVLAFQFDIDVSLIERWRISIDAHNGQIVNKVTLVNTCFNKKDHPLPYSTGTGLTNYYGSKTIRVETLDNGYSRLVGQTEHGGRMATYDFQNASERYLMFGFINWPDFLSADNTYNDSYDKPAVSVQWAVEQAYEYYFKRHSRNSFDNNNGLIKSYAHVGTDLDNAFWTGNALALGDGSNNNPLVELDVISHELTHGVTQYEAQLLYENEPGALNESFSDIMGKAVEFSTFGDSATWQMGRRFQDGGLRDFSNPNARNQADTYAGDMWYTGTSDNGGVHFNSGVQNFWFYLLCEGGSGVNDHQFSYSIESIGRDAAIDITYRNLTEYLNSSSDYLDSRIGSLLATADLFGQSSSIYQEVNKAWDAVGVINKPIITSLSVHDITATRVKIKSSLLPRGDNASYHFEYGTTLAFENLSSVYAYTTDDIESTLTGLISNTKYYLRLVATNENGTTYGSPLQFTTISLAPLVKIKRTTDVTETTAIMYGQVNPNSLTTSFYFEYGTTAALGLTTPTYLLNDTTEFLNVSASVINLAPRQTYYYRLVATNSSASSKTESVIFFTATKPIINSFMPVSAPINTTVTITGENFNPTPKNNIVSFGATRATVISASSSEIKVNVPPGTSLGIISLLDVESGLSGESIEEFIPTYTGEFKHGALQLRARFDDSGINQTIVEDIDDDGKPDIVVSQNQGFVVFQNVNTGGDITDDSFVRNYYNGSYTGKIVLADIDGNGLKDIIIQSSDGGFRVHRNLSVPGYIFFELPVNVPAGFLSDIVADDFDMDGHIDIAAISHLAGDSTALLFFRNKIPKGFLSADNFEMHSSKILPYYAYRLFNDDLNNDGKVDLIISRPDPGLFQILNNKHGFSFEEVTIKDSTSTGWSFFISQDLNQNGQKDIVSAAAKLAVLENRSNVSNIIMAKPVQLKDSISVNVQTGDIDGDGKVDLITGTSDSGFNILKNQVETGGHLSDSSFYLFEHYSDADDNDNTIDVNINDLNGDGRPDIISRTNYGSFMEIWQNSATSCALDPTLISVSVLSNSSAMILLPPHTTLDQFQIEFNDGSSSDWSSISSTTVDVWPGHTFQLRARAQCYLGFSPYYYFEFTTDCVDMSSFKVATTGINYVTLNASSDLSYFEVQYAPAGTEQWKVQIWYSSSISDLVPGTTYDLRYRTTCKTETEFEYLEFTTLCPLLESLYVFPSSNSAIVSTWSRYGGQIILEYSKDNVDWNLIDDTHTISPLVPGLKYFVRGKAGCLNADSDFIYATFTTPCPEVSGLNVDVVSPFGANVTWLDETNTNQYLITYSRREGGNITTKKTDFTSWHIDDLTPGTDYKISVAAQCLAEPDYATATFSTLCYVPYNLTAYAVSPNTTKLSWDTDFTNVPYDIDYTITGSNQWMSIDAASNTIQLTNLQPGTEYEARVHITCLSVTEPYVSLHFAAGVYDATMFAPNPTNNTITIYPSRNLIGSHFSIYDNMGREAGHGVLIDYIIDLSDFATGLYTVRIDGEKPMKVVKH